MRRRFQYSMAAQQVGIEPRRNLRRKSVGKKDCGKDAAWKSTNHFSYALLNLSYRAGFTLSHSHADDGPNPRAAEQIQNQARVLTCDWTKNRGHARGAGVFPLAPLSQVNSCVTGLELLGKSFR